jgi:hypothetical protein
MFRRVPLEERFPKLPLVNWPTLEQAMSQADEGPGTRMRFIQVRYHGFYIYRFDFGGWHKEYHPDSLKALGFRNNGEPHGHHAVADNFVRELVELGYDTRTLGNSIFCECFSGCEYGARPGGTKPIIIIDGDSSKFRYPDVKALKRDLEACVPDYLGLVVDLSV